jgi:ribosome-associated heat shock protein Hsp15
MSDSQRPRIDTWLKHVCLFKHRVDATDACRGGHVKVNGQSAKPAAAVREQDVVELQLGETYRRVVVTSIPATQQSKELARTMYVDETPAREKPVMPQPPRDRGTGRPTKRERRESEKFKGSW